MRLPLGGVDDPGFINYADVYGFALVIATLVGGLALLGAILWVGWFYSTRRTFHHSPYSELPLRHCRDLSYASIGKIYLYLTGLRQYDNRMPNIHRVVVCRETGRVFPDAVDWLGRITLDWSFLQRRYPGAYVSWGSLTYRQQQVIREAHTTLAGFQTEQSSAHPSPRMIEAEFALAKPGPLYVDLDTLTLLGWKLVPGSDLEVLIVQKPKRAVAPTAQQEVRPKS